MIVNVIQEFKKLYIKCQCYDLSNCVCVRVFMMFIIGIIFKSNIRIITNYYDFTYIINLNKI